MEIHVRLAGGSRLVKISADTPEELFADLAAAYEIFDEFTCGLCGSAHIRPVHRIAENYHFYEYHCQQPGCGGRLSLGQLNDESGALFPVRKLRAKGKPDFRAGQPGEHRGWTKYRGLPKEEN